MLVKPFDQWRRADLAALHTCAGDRQDCDGNHSIDQRYFTDQLCLIGCPAAGRVGGDHQDGVRRVHGEAVQRDLGQRHFTDQLCLIGCLARGGGARRARGEAAQRELVKRLFSLWFYVFVGGVLLFLVVILAENYLGMMLISHFLLFGVMALLGSFGLYLYHFFHKNFPHPALAFLLSGLALLFATSGYGIMNIYFLKGIHFGTIPPLHPDRMWIYHSHTHAALLGWITCSFIGMLYIVIPSITHSNSLETLRSERALSALLPRPVMNKAFRQLTVLLLSATAILIAFFLENDTLLGVAGAVYGCAVYYVSVNLRLEMK